MIYTGVSGWTYEPWRGVFYPLGLKAQDELSYASKMLSSIEVNGTFYGLKYPKDFARWADAVPDHFPLAVKAPRYITHICKLHRVEIPIANFLASGPLALGTKMGPILWQLPSSMDFERSVIETFLALLPHTGHEAMKIAERHDEKVKGRQFLDVQNDLVVRHAVEVRHLSFSHPDFSALLKEYNIAGVFSDSDGAFPVLTDQTADFIYMRLHGMGSHHVEGYSVKELKHWAEKILTLTSQNVLDAFVYFDNQEKITAPGNAIEFARICSPNHW